MSGEKRKSAGESEGGNFETEELKVKGEELWKKVKELVKEGNVQKIVIKNNEDEVLLKIPVTFGVVGTLIAPVFAAVGALGAMVGFYRVEIIRNASAKKSESKSAGSSSKKKPSSSKSEASGSKVKSQKGGKSKSSKRLIAGSKSKKSS